MESLSEEDLTLAFLINLYFKYGNGCFSFRLQKQRARQHHFAPLYFGSFRFISTCCFCSWIWVFIKSSQKSSGAQALQTLLARKEDLVNYNRLYVAATFEGILGIPL